jgi:hypothetical protein
MAKDFFVDLTQPEKPEREERREPQERQEQERTIRNVMVNRRAPGPRHIEAREPVRRKRGKKSAFAWIIAAVALVILLGLIVLALLSKSTVTVTPRVHNITFDPAAPFIAMPDGGSGLTYSVETVTLDDRIIVPAQGTERVEDRATGNITVYNDYSDAPVRLIKNTRFEAPGGLIYRIPASVVVPGRSGSTSGTASVTVIADSAGLTYNSGPIERLNVPGLKSTPAMFSGVYAKAPEGMSGGFVGDRPAVSADALERARTELRTKLADKFRTEASNREDALVATALAEFRYEHLPTELDPAGARIGERLTARVPVFDRNAFASAIGEAVSAEPGADSVSLVNGSAFSIGPSATGTPLDGPLRISLSGSAALVWRVDTAELKTALLGKEKAAFTPIVAQFSAIEKADAEVAPFWSRRFPSDPEKLIIEVKSPPTP